MHDQSGQPLTTLFLRLGLLKEDCGGQKDLRAHVETCRLQDGRANLSSFSLHAGE
jgi:hypothetical protein